MTDWLKFYIGGLIADISAHKAMIEAQQAEIDKLKRPVAITDAMVAAASDSAMHKLTNTEEERHALMRAALEAALAVKADD